MTIQNIVIGGLVALALLLGFTVFSSPKVVEVTPPVGAASGQSHFQVKSFLQGLTGGGRDQFSVSNAGLLTLGTSGTALTSIIATTCTGIVYASLGATTTQPIACAVTGALTTAKAVYFGTKAGNFASGSILGNLPIWGGHASSTAGYVEGYITNLTGAATTSYSQATTSIPVLVIQ